MNEAGPVAVLCGGASRRMGRDKALIPVQGVAMAVRVAQAAAESRAELILAVGGDGPGLAAAGLDAVPAARWVPDRWPGEGPLGGVIAALEWCLHHGGLTGDGEVVVLPCDWVDPNRSTIQALQYRLRTAEPQADVVVPVDTGGQYHWLPAAWRAGAAGPLAEAFEAGERSLHRAVAAAGLRMHELRGVPPEQLADADVPTDLLPAEDHVPDRP